MSKALASMERAAHSVVGASSADRWVRCPGSTALIAKHPCPPGAGKDAGLGTCVHDALRQLLTKGCLLKSIDFLGRRASVDAKGQVVWGPKGDHVLDRSCVDALQFAIDFVKQIIEDEVIPAARAAGVEFEIHLEYELSLASIDERMFGTADIVIVIPFVKAWVLDYKNGAGVAVNAEANHQLAYYGLGTSLSFGVSCVSSFIIQPRVFRGDRTSRMDLDAYELTRWEGVFSVGAAATLNPNAPRCAGTKQCQWCPCKVATKDDAWFCREHLEWQTEGIDAAFDAVSGKVALPVVNLANMAKILAGRNRLKLWLDEVDKLEAELLRRKTPPPGWKVGVGKKPAREWTDEVAMANRFANTPVDVWKKTVYTPTQLEKQNPEAYRIVADLVMQAEAKPALVREGKENEAIDALFE